MLVISSQHIAPRTDNLDSAFTHGCD